MADLQQSGIELVVKNAQQAIRDLKAYQTALGQQNKSVTQAAQASSGTSRIVSALTKDFSKFGQNLLNQVPGVSKFGNLLGELGSAGTAAAAGSEAAAAGTAALAGGMSLALPVIGAVVVSLGALFALGSRGAKLQSTIDAFGNIAGEFGNTTTMLNRLREQTKGTISDMELMRIATFALSGTSKELGTILAENLGKNLNDVGRLAQAIGRDPTEAQNRWIDAIKKGERELLDELGIIVSANEAYKNYAKSVNKSADSLTAYEKQAAFAQEATRQLNEAVAKLPEQSNILTTLKRIPVALKNVFDKLSLAVQPIFAPLAQALGSLVDLFTGIATRIIQILAPAWQVMGAIISEVFATASHIVKTFFGGLGDSASSTLDYVIAFFQLAGEAIVTVIHNAGEALRRGADIVKNAFNKLVEPINRLFSKAGDTASNAINQLAFNLGKGGAFIIGAFAAGILRGGTFVTEAVTKIAQIVADFLVGFSPPKKGPLSEIDKGGENIAVSWVDGFLGGVQKTFSQVTAYVNSRLGAIAKLSRDQIEARLAALDLALRPFKENLAIVKSDMEAIAGFTDPALRVLERQRTALLKAFGEGKIADVEQLRNLDRQVQRMKELKDFGQDQVDQAELQLALASSQQAQERALLGIQKDRLGVAEKTGAAAGAGEKATKGGGGGGAAETGAGGAGAGIGGGEAPDLLTTEGIENAKEQIIKTLSGIAGSASAGISEGLAESGFSSALSGFKSQGADLSKQLSRIAKSNPVQAIADKFTGLKDAVTGAFDDFKTYVEGVFTDLFGGSGNVALSLDTFKTKLEGIFTAEDSPLMIAKSKVQELAVSVAFNISQITTSIMNNFQPITDAFNALFVNEDSVLAISKQALIDAVDEISTQFTMLRDDISLKITDISTFLTGLFVGENGAIEVSKRAITGFVNSVINEFFRLSGEGAGTLREALASLGTVLRSVVLMPVKGAMEGVANLAVDALNSIIRTYNGLPFGGGVEIDEIAPVHLNFQAKGTLGKLSAPFIAGEKGAELIAPSKQNPLSVFPARATNALVALSSLLQKPAPMAQYIPAAPMQSDNSQTTNIRDSYNNRNVTFNSRYKQSRLEQLQLASRA